MTRKRREDLAEKIKIFMLKKGWTQRGLASKLNVKPQTISSFLSGKYNMKTETLEAISEALGVSPNYFFDNSSTVGGDNITADNHSQASKTEDKDFQLLKAEMEILKKEVQLQRKELENISLKLSLLQAKKK